MEKSVFCMLFALVWVSSAHLELCVSLNEEGRALLAIKERIEVDPSGALSSWRRDVDSPCLWFGVECSDDGHVLALNLRDLSLKGVLAPEIGELTYLKSIILQNNSFYGVIPREFGKLHNLELLDLGHNNISGPLPSELGNISSLQILKVGSNKFICSLSPELYDCSLLLKNQADEELLSSTRQLPTRIVENVAIRRLLQGGGGRSNGNNPSSSGPASRNSAHSPAPAPNSAHSPAPAPAPAGPVSPPRHPPINKPSSEPPPPATGDRTGEAKGSSGNKPLVIILLSVGGAILFLITIAAAYFAYRAHKAVTVKPWATGLSGQLQKAFVSGVSSLRRLELETACEQFNNIIASSSNCTLYKGNLSSGVEITVISTTVTSAEDWPEQSEALFRNKISSMSQVNHKNFMNLLGYCEEGEPFTRMMVFEYAPNGTLFEHLHIKEAEHLDWSQRMRVIMGLAYCLQQMEQLNPPFVPKNLASSSIYLTEDYAAKISDLEFWSEEKEEKLTPENLNQESIVYKFGIILLEIISGRLPFSEDDGLLVLWASSYLNGKRSLKDMVDRTLNSVREEEITELADIIRSCINASPEKRPTMADVTERMRMITSITQEEASPRASPLWWAELEIISQ